MSNVVVCDVLFCNILFALLRFASIRIYLSVSICADTYFRLRLLLDVSLFDLHVVVFAVSQFATAVTASISNNIPSSAYLEADFKVQAGFEHGPPLFHIQT